MNKLLICITIFLTGCGLLPVRTEYVKVSYPILTCPAPPKIERPVLYISKLTDQDLTNYKKISQYYDISFQQLFNYIRTLEIIIEHYDETSKSYQQLEKELNMMVIKENKE